MKKLSKKISRSRGNGNASAVGLVARSYTVSKSVGLPPLRPDKLRVTLRYQYSATLAAPLGHDDAFTVVSMNSPYDPQYTVGGGSCTGFAEWMALYEKFHVERCSIAMTIQNPNAGSSLVAFLLPVSSAAAIAGVTPSLDKVKESDIAVFCDQAIGTQPGNNLLVRKSWSPHQFEGVPPSSDVNDFSGSGSADPYVQPAIYCGFITNDGVTALTAYVHLIADYVTTLYRPTLLGA